VDVQYQLLKDQLHQEGVIGVQYATDRVGAFTKTVTVTSNAEGQPTKILTIKGVVLSEMVQKLKSKLSHKKALMGFFYSTNALLE
jgi:hypothetical protein